MKLPLVTIYVLNYNYSMYLSKCIESVLEQTYSNLEIIVIDDGSNDGSQDIINQYADKNSSIKVIFQENAGLISANRRVYNIANGDYVVRVDADDWVEPNFVGELVSKAMSNPAVALVFPDYHEVDETGNIIRRVKRRDFDDSLTLLDQPAHGACSLIKKEFYDSVGGYTEGLASQDGYDIWLSLLGKYRFANVQKPLFFYRKHSASLTVDNRKILESRSKVYALHAAKRGFEPDDNIAFIPIRSRKLGNSDFNLMRLGAKNIIDWTIEKASFSPLISSIIVATDSVAIANHVNAMWNRPSAKQLEVYCRDDGLSKQGVDVIKTIVDYLIKKRRQSLPNHLVLLTPNYPFLSSFYIDTGIHSIFVHKTEAVESVVENNSILYRHDGNSLRSISDERIRYEINSVYQRSGGMTVYSKSYLEKLINSTPKEKNGVKMGHIVVDRWATIEVYDQMSLRMACCLVDEFGV